MRFLITCLLLCLPAGPLAAQQAGQRSCRILFLQRPAEAPEKLYLFDGTGATEVELPRMNFSPTYGISAEASAVVLLAAPPADPKAIPAGAPMAALPASIRDFYLIVTHAPDNPVVPVRLQVIDASAEKLKAGEMLWFNLTGNAISGQLGSQQLVLAPQSRKVIGAPANSRGDYGVNLSFRIPDDPRDRPLCQTQWRHDPRSRTVYFVVMAPESRIPRVLGFADFHEPKKE